VPVPIRQALLKLDLIVIGAGKQSFFLSLVSHDLTCHRILAGIGGLATAIALARSGHRVRIFDKLDGSRQVFAIHLPCPDIGALTILQCHAY
jgi:hypothetical protein